MVLKYIYRLSCLSYFIQTAVALTMVDDADESITYSNSGPAWWAATSYNGRGKYISGQLGVDTFAWDVTWHEVVGNGATITFKFAGTRISLVSTVPNVGYNTTLNFYIDDEFQSQYQHLVPGPPTIYNPQAAYISNITLRVTIADFPDLPAAQHTFKAVSVGDDTLMVVDALFYEPANVTTTASSTSGSTTQSTLTTASTSSSSSSSSNSNSTSTTSRTITQPTLAAPTIATGDSQPLVASMDVNALDSRIVYSPPGAWKQYSNARRATSCLEGTMISSTVNSSLTYNFTGSVIQLYTVPAPNGGNYTISIDGVNQGSYSSYDASADPSSCPSKSLFSTAALTNTEHTLALTVQDHPSGSTQATIQFVGFRTPSSTANVNSSTSSSSSLNLGAIIGGVAGGIAGLALLVFLIIRWMRRQRRLSEGSEITQFPDPSLHSTFTESHTHSQAQWESSVPPFTIPQYPQYQEAPNYDYTAAPPTTHTEDEDEASTHLDRLTYYTLPSYHENVRDRPAARDLSNADVDAISRRLQEVMRSQMVQSGAGQNSLVGAEPPRELIDHLVEEQRQPRAL